MNKIMGEIKFYILHEKFIQGVKDKKKLFNI